MPATFSNLFSTLFSDEENITIIRRLLPYLSPEIGQFLSTQLKVTDVRKILSQNEYEESLHALNAESDPQDMIQVLQSIKGSVSKEKAKQIDEVLSLLQFTQLYTQYQTNSKQTTANSNSYGNPSSSPATQGMDFQNVNPQMLSSLQNMNLQNVFSDPAVFSMLSQMAGNENQMLLSAIRDRFIHK